MHKGNAMSFNFFLYITKQNNLKKKEKQECKCKQTN